MREWVPKPISQIQVSRTLLTPESTFGVILRYCAICVKNQFLSIFGQNRVKIFILVINSSINGGFSVYLSNIYYN